MTSLGKGFNKNVTSQIFGILYWFKASDSVQVILKYGIEYKVFF